MINQPHFVNGHRIIPPFPTNTEVAIFGLGCFWGAERKFWQSAGVFSTAVGYAGGKINNPTYDKICTGITGHAEVVKVIFEPEVISYTALLVLFWESHNPTQGMQQGNDIGTQYRSCIFSFSPQQQQQAEYSKSHYQQRLTTKGLGTITTEIVPTPEFYYAEAYHQQYLAKNPTGYCGLGGLAVKFQTPISF
jgi:peptide-methionine (S)-S-oxide reductase